MKERDKINIYVDMDGVQAVYGFGDSVEEMATPGYFRERPAQQNMVDTVRRLQGDQRYHVVVLSSVFSDRHSAQDKVWWLEEQGLGDVETCFVPCGERKCDYVEKEGVNILVDDFSRNLFEWESMGGNFHGIKFLNEKNGSCGSWFNAGGYSVNFNMTTDRLYNAITGLANALAG